jgi:adenylyltransferase/sulfurtransferase
MDDGFERRFARQRILPQLGSDGQEKLSQAHVAIVGCGALGCASAEQLVRMGVGTITLIDRDVVEWSNLPRQVLFDEADATAGTAKAHAGAARLRRINARTTLHAHAEDVTARTVERLIDASVKLVVDGTDNFHTRYLLNDLAVKRSVPLMYGGVLGTAGTAMTLVEQGPCLRCIVPSPPAPASQPTCETAGVLLAAVQMVASVQVVEAAKVLLDSPAAPCLVQFDVWSGEWRRMELGPESKDAACVCCGERRFDFLDGEAGHGEDPAAMCGQNSVQIPAPRGVQVDLAAIAERFRGVADVHLTPHMLRLDLKDPQARLTIFPGGRVLVRGVDSVQAARTLAARVLG